MGVGPASAKGGETPRAPAAWRRWTSAGTDGEKTQIASTKGATGMIPKSPPQKPGNEEVPPACELHPAAQRRSTNVMEILD